MRGALLSDPPSTTRPKAKRRAGAKVAPTARLYEKKRPPPHTNTAAPQGLPNNKTPAAQVLPAPETGRGCHVPAPCLAVRVRRAVNRFQTGCRPGFMVRRGACGERKRLTGSATSGRLAGRKKPEMCATTFRAEKSCSRRKGAERHPFTCSIGTLHHSGTRVHSKTHPVMV